MLKYKYEERKISKWRLSAYINGNAEIYKIALDKNWIYSSYLDYLGKRNGTLYYKILF